jgi:chromosome segregation ATPase
MNFKEVVAEELTADIEAIKAQIKQLQANVTERDEVIKKKDEAIKELQARLSGVAAKQNQQQPKIGIGTRRTIGKPANPPQEKEV